MWDSFKAYVQDIFISIKAFRDKQNNKVRVELIDQIGKLEHELKEGASWGKPQKLLALYEDIKIMDAQNIAWEILYAK